METLWITWVACAVLIGAFYMWVGKATTKSSNGTDYAGSFLGFLIDDRGRYSLTRFQLSLWTLVVLSLTAGVFASRAATPGVDPLGFTIPAEVLGLLGISAGSAAIATGVKAHKNRTRPLFVAASLPGDATLAQMLMVEEGPQADSIVDIYKLQNFLVTVFLAAAYVVLAIHTYAGWGPGMPITSPKDITTLPTFSSTFLTLLAISHAGYLGGKLPDRGQDPVHDAPKDSLVRVNAQRKSPGARTFNAAAAEQAEKIRSDVQAGQQTTTGAASAASPVVSVPTGAKLTEAEEATETTTPSGDPV